MSDIKLFRVRNDQVEALQGTSVAVERSLQLLIERHLETMLGERLLGTEYRTGKTHGGRIDSLGIDENGSPVIIEHKRATNENVINQGLYYLAGIATLPRAEGWSTYWSARRSPPVPAPGSQTLSVALGRMTFTIAVMSGRG